MKRDTCGNWDKENHLCNGSKACAMCSHYGKEKKCANCNDCWTCKFKKKSEGTK